MSNPARKLREEGEGAPEGNRGPRLVPKRETYDTSGSADSAPGTGATLRGMRGGGEGDGIPRGQLRSVSDSASPSKALDGKELGEQEDEALGKPGIKPSKSEKGLIGAGLNKADKFLPPQARIAAVVTKIFTKKRSAVGAVVGMIAAFLIFLFSIGSGPLQLVHLSELLAKNFFGQEQSSKIRLKNHWRFHRTSDVGETRVTKLGSEVFKKTVSKLEKIGFDFSDRNALTGHLKSVKVNVDQHPAFKDLPPADRQAAFLKHFDIKDPSIVTRNGSTFKINLDVTNVKGIDFANSLVGTAVGDLQDGHISTGMGLRSMKKFYNLPKLFSPLEKRTKAQEAKLATKAERRAAEKERLKAMNDSSTSRAATARDKLKDKLGGKAATFAASTLVMTEALCIVRDVADSVVTVNRFNIVVPAVLQAVDKTAVGSQVKSGKNITPRAAGQVAESFIDENGQTIFGGKAMQALSGKKNLSGQDLDYEYQQAFSNDTTAAKIKDSVGSPELFGIDFGGAACSTLGQIVQGAVSIGLAFGAILAAIPSGGASVALVAGKTTASAAASAGAIYFIQKAFVKLLASDAIVPAVLSGPLGGNLLAYGAREAGNIGARTAGGIALTATQAAALDDEQEQQSRQEFQQKSFASRMFDVNDYRSLASNFIDHTSPNPVQNFTDTAGSLTNVGSIASNLFSGFMPRAFAQATTSKPYDWGFPRYGITKDILEDPDFEDPYDNADKVAVLLDNGTGGYVDRAKKCFGVDIAKGADGLWDVTPVDETNPNSEDYDGAKCDDTSSKNWKRIILFVFDTQLLTSLDCYQGGEDSCNKLSAENVGGAGAPAGAAPTAAPAGTADLTKTITVSTPGTFITMPSHYSCPGRTTKIDSRIAASLAYLLTTYNMCADDGLANGHKSHGAGLGVDIRPRDQAKQNSKAEWIATVEKAARDMGWTGDAADEPKGTQNGCAPAYSGYGNCVGGNGNIPTWVRWMGYNGDVDHGDPWHVFGGSYAHIHIGWASPNGGDAVAPSIISSPIPAVLTFEAPIPADLQALIK